MFLCVCVCEYKQWCSRAGKHMFLTWFMHFFWQDKGAVCSRAYSTEKLNNLSLFSLFFSEQHWRTSESQRTSTGLRLTVCDQQMSPVHASPCMPLPHHYELWAGLWRWGLGSDPHATTAHAWKGTSLLLTLFMNDYMLKHILFSAYLLLLYKLYT